MVEYSPESVRLPGPNDRRAFLLPRPERAPWRHAFFVEQ
jgi:hypothetical protein